MTVLATLWLPIGVAAVFVFIASSVIHMALPWWHKSDYGKLPEEGRVMDALSPFKLPPGDYMVPNCDNQREMRSPEFKAKMEQGPVMVVTVMTYRGMQIGSSLAKWFLYILAVSALTGYVACHAAQLNGTHASIYRIVGVTAWLGYAAALWPISIWYRRSWLTTIKSTIDGLVYAGITAATFVWLWPR